MSGATTALWEVGTGKAEEWVMSWVGKNEEGRAWGNVGKELERGRESGHSKA